MHIVGRPTIVPIFSAASALQVFQLIVGPYSSRSDEFFATSCNFLLVILYVCCGTFRFGELTHSADVQKLMSPEEREEYLIPYVALSSIMFATCTGVLVVLGIILLFLAIQDTEYRRRAARSAMMRRLRYISNDKEVELIQLPEWPAHLIPRSQCLPTQPGPFHIFLSHNWAQVCAQQSAATLCSSPSAIGGYV